MSSKTKIPKQFTLQLKPKHFKNTEFTDCQNCAISKAVKEMFPDAVVSEQLNWIHINGRNYFHKFYGPMEFTEDQKSTQEVVRELICTRAD